MELMQGGRLHRYNVDEGELSEVSMLETEYAAYQGSKYCFARASGWLCNSYCFGRWGT